MNVSREQKKNNKKPFILYVSLKNRLSASAILVTFFIYCYWEHGFIYLLSVN